MEDTDLHIAVRLDDLNDVKEALFQGLDPNQIGLYEWSPLHEASFNGNLDIIELLLKFNGDPNKPDVLRGFTAMHHAASQGNYECLQALTNAGGDCNTRNTDGKIPLDVAQRNCVDLLQNLNQTKAQNSLTSDGNPQKEPTTEMENPANQDSIELIDAAPNCEIAQITSSIEFDRISLASDHSASSASSWNSGVLDFHTDLVMGHAVLSFEYNKKAQTFKIRVWELLDFILPPVETSMIQDVFVRSYLLPDKNKKTKRNTEYMSAAKLSKCAKPAQEFRPVNIKFTKALEYKDITQDLVEQKTVYLEVCMRQKYTWRNFVLATWNTPMSVAVKYLTKEKYPLTPKVSTTIPSNMKVYSAHRLHIVSNRGLVSSCPNSRTASRSSLEVSFKEQRSSSHPDFLEVTVHATANPSIEVTVPNDDDAENVSSDSLQQVVTASTKSQNSHNISMEIAKDDTELHSITTQV